MTENSTATGAVTILEPDLPIIDSHFHLFDLPHIRYMLEEYLADAQGGHNVIASVYNETRAFMRDSGPEVMRPLGEVEFANGMAAIAASGRYGKCRVAAGIVGHADLTHGADVAPLLDRCMETAPERYRGIRHVTLDYPDERPFKFIMSGRPPSGILEHPKFIDGLAELEKRGLTFDAAIYDPSLPKLTEIVDQLPNLTFILNNMSTLVLVDMTEQEKAETIQTWQSNLRELAKRPNVLCKAGGLGMPTWDFTYRESKENISYQELADTWRPYVEIALDAFGIERCMFGSNFPPDSRSSNYVTLLNAYKQIFSNYSAAEKVQFFTKTAAQAYRLDLEAL